MLNWIRVYSSQKATSELATFPVETQINTRIIFGEVKTWSNRKLLKPIQTQSLFCCSQIFTGRVRNYQSSGFCRSSDEICINTRTLRWCEQKPFPHHCGCSPRSSLPSPELTPAWCKSFWMCLGYLSQLHACSWPAGRFHPCSSSWVAGYI